MIVVMLGPKIDLLGLAAEEIGRGDARRVDQRGRLLARHERAVDVRVRAPQVIRHRVDHDIRHLRAARAVEEHERPAVGPGAGERREAAADGVDVGQRDSSDGRGGCAAQDRLAPMTTIPDRDLALEIVRATESGALAASRQVGRGDKIAADQAAVDGMRALFDTVNMDGIVVIGEGEKDEAPMLYNGEKVGDGSGPEVDVAVDPLEGTTLAAKGMPNALSVVAISARGSMFDPGPCVYMEKLAGGSDLADLLSLTDPIEDVLHARRQEARRDDRRPHGGRARPPAARRR